MLPRYPWDPSTLHLSTPRESYLQVRDATVGELEAEEHVLAAEREHAQARCAVRNSQFMLHVAAVGAPGDRTPLPVNPRRLYEADQPVPGGQA